MARTPAFISHSREREARIQRNLLEVLEGRFKKPYAQEVERASSSLLSAYGVGGFVPTIPDEHYQNLRRIYLDMTLQSIRTFGIRIVGAGMVKAAPYTVDDGRTWSFAAGNGVQVDTKDFSFADFFQALAQSYIQLEAVRRRITSVAETTRNQIVNQVERGQVQGLGVDAIAGNISENIPGISKSRGALIARTDVHGAANFGAHETAKRTGLELEKEWISVEDHRTRDFGEGDGVADEFDHRAMDGQTVPMDDPFLMPWLKGGHVTCMYPGDPTLPPAASINCRCAVAHQVVGLDD